MSAYICYQMRQLILLCIVMTAISTQSLLADNHFMSPSSVEMTDPPRPPRVNFSPFLCADEQTDVVLFLIDREPGVNYTWDIPASIMSETTFSANGDTVFIADISAWNFILDFITITAENSCDAVFERLFIELGAPLTLQELPLDTSVLEEL